MIILPLLYNRWEQWKTEHLNPIFENKPEHLNHDHRIARALMNHEDKYANHEMNHEMKWENHDDHEVKFVNHEMNHENHDFGLRNWEIKGSGNHDVKKRTIPEKESSESAETLQTSNHSPVKTGKLSLARVIKDRREDAAGQFKSLKARKKLANNNPNYSA